MTTPVADVDGCQCVYCTDLGAPELCRGYDRPDVPALTDGEGAFERLTKSMWAKAAVCNVIAAQVGCGGVMWKNWEQQANDLRTVLAQASAYKERVEALEKALEPFANLGVTSGPDDEPCTIPYRITRGSIRQARALLNGADR